MSKVKQILNLHEAVTHQRLSKMCKEYSASVYPKMRIADVLPIENSGIDDSLFRFALMAHFDFVVVEKQNPIFAVEFDGPSHDSDQQKWRDEKKFHLCRHFDFSLLRITARYLPSIYRGYDLLSWCVEQWFLLRGLAEAQSRGELPPDELIDPMMIVGLPGREGLFPMWLSAEPRSKIESLCKGGQCHDFAPSDWVGVDESHNYHGIMWLCISEDSFIYAEVSARAQNFPIIVSELVSEVLTFDLFKTLQRVLRGEELLVSGPFIDRLVNTYSERYQMTMAAGSKRGST
jgi:hypothetical protein